MSQELSNIQQQEQTLEMQQRLTASQVAYMRMLEMPIEDLRERIQKELEENVALEAGNDDASETDNSNDQYESISDNEGDEGDGSDDEKGDGNEEVTGDGSESESLDQGLIDEIDYFDSERVSRGNYGEEEDEHTIEDADTPHFRDTLMTQVGEYELTDKQRTLLEYLIGSLDDDGLLKKKLYVIADELEVYMNIHADTEELETVLHILQQFDPPGIGATSLQETLLLQIDARRAERPDNRLWQQLRRIVDTRWEDLTSNHWQTIALRMKLNEGETNALRRMLRTLTPSPGLAPGESVSTAGTNAITADFVIDVSLDGTITVSLNEPGIPTLRVSTEYEAMSRQSSKLMPGRTFNERRQTQDYLRGSVLRAGTFLMHLRNRQQTMLRIMREVVAAQRDYLLSGDESQLHTLVMKDMADRLGMDISIVSRVASNKWASTPYGMRQVRWFFRTAGGVTTDDGTQLEQDRLLHAVAEAIANEDKRAPLSDDKLAKLLQQQGYPIARRTVAKYREMQQIPVARLRK